MNERIEAESEWISRVVLHDDHLAFAELVHLHQAPVRRFLGRLCGDDWQRADDLAQDTFWKAYRNIGGYRGSGRFLSWLFGIAWQLYSGQQRSGGGRMHVSLEDMSMEGMSMDLADDVPGDVDLHALEQLLGQLRPEEQAAILLHYRHGLTHQEAAAALGVPLGTVKSLIVRARAKLRRMANPEAPNEGGQDA